VLDAETATDLYLLYHRAEVRSSAEERTWFEVEVQGRGYGSHQRRFYL
jgi:hypothetical protein